MRGGIYGAPSLFYLVIGGKLETTRILMFEKSLGSN
jgi:hypothetical protein